MLHPKVMVRYLFADDVETVPGAARTVLSDASEGRTRFRRSFLWVEPADPDVSTTLRPTMEGTAIAGDAAIKQAFES